MLYQADVRGEPLEIVVAAEAERALSEPGRQASWLYAREILDGIVDNQDEIDELVLTYAHGWSLERMPTIDRAIVRIATWELMHNPEVPAPVAIDEAVELAKTLSTDDSGRYVNGVLGRIADHARVEGRS